jgi:orotate phosphoribosyltransferase
VHFLASLYQAKAIQTWMRDRPEGWELTSGDWSPFYFAFRDVPSSPALMSESVRLLATSVLRWEGQYDRLIGVASTGIALTGAVAHLLGVPMGFTRKVVGVRTAADLERATAQWGGHSIVEGVLNGGDRLLIVDDVISTFASKATAMAQIEAEASARGVQVETVGVAVVVDRGPAPTGPTPVPVTSALVLRDHINELTEAGASEREIQVIRDYLKAPHEFQDPGIREALTDEALMKP